MSWDVPQSPSPQAHPSWVSTVDDALLTRCLRGRLHTVAAPHAPRTWMTGAVHDGLGDLVHASVRPWSGDLAAPVAVDPESVAVPTSARRLQGTWRYAGNWTGHFGHFFLEVLTTLWGPAPEATGLVLHRTTRAQSGFRKRQALRAPETVPWQRELLRLAGFGDCELRVVMNRPVRVDRLVVPSRAVLLKSWAAPEAVEVWRRISDAVGERGDAHRVFLSRSLFHQGELESDRSRRSEAAWDAQLDEVFARAGFAVVHPERLPLPEQLAVVRGADVLAGASGSALHLSAFARPGVQVLEIGDRRSPRAPMPTQQMIDAACGHRTAFVPHLDEAELRRVLATLEA